MPRPFLEEEAHVSVGGDADVDVGSATKYHGHFLMTRLNAQVSVRGDLKV